MLVARSKWIFLASYRNLYSSAAMGVDNFVDTRLKMKERFREVEKKFKEKMAEYVKEDNSGMIFTEDLKNMVHLVDGNEKELELVRKMILKFSDQSKKALRFGTFIFGPVVMRMYFHLDKPIEALNAFKELEKDGFFDQLISYQILMDLLLKHNMLQEILDVFDSLKDKQLYGSKFPKNAVVLVLAACYKLNSPDSFNYAKSLWSELTQSGNYPMRRAGTFAAALSILQGQPDVALEILTSLKQQTYVTVRNLKISAFCDLGRPDDALSLMKGLLSMDRSVEKNTICEEVVNKLTLALQKFGRDELSQEFEKMYSQLSALGHIDSTPLADLLCQEISAFDSTESRNTSKTNLTSRYYNQVNSRFHARLQDMD